MGDESMTYDPLERSLCDSISSGSMRFAELPLSEYIGVVDVSLDLQPGYEEHVYVAYDYYRRNSHAEDWLVVKAFVEENYPDAPWVKHGLDNEMFDDLTGNMVRSILNWDDTMSVNKFADRYGTEYRGLISEQVSMLQATRRVTELEYVNILRDAHGRAVDYELVYFNPQAAEGKGAFVVVTDSLIAEVCAMADDESLHLGTNDRRSEYYVDFGTPEFASIAEKVRRTSSFDYVGTDGATFIKKELFKEMEADPSRHIHGGYARLDGDHVISTDDPELRVYTRQLEVAGMVFYDYQNDNMALPDVAIFQRDSDGQLTYSGSDGIATDRYEAALDAVRKNLVEPKFIGADAKATIASTALGHEVVADKSVGVIYGGSLPQRVVLAREGDDALVFTGINSPEPFVVAHGYDEATNSWSHGSYYSDLGYAWDEFRPEIIEGATIRWEREDFEKALENQGIEPTDANVQALINETVDMRGLKDIATEHGSEYIEECVSGVDFPDKAVNCQDVSRRIDELKRSINDCWDFGDYSAAHELEAELHKLAQTDCASLDAEFCSSMNDARDAQSSSHEGRVETMRDLPSNVLE